MGEHLKTLAPHAGQPGRTRAQLMRGLAGWGPALPLIGLLAFCLLAPTAALLARAFVTVDGLGLSAWERVLGSSINQRAIVTSVQLGLVCATVSVLVGTPLAWLVSRMLVGRRAAWLGLLNVGAHFGGIGLAFAYVVTLGSFGVVTLLIQALGAADFQPPQRGSLTALVIAYEHANIPLFVLLLVPAMGTLREEWWEAAQASSATRLQFWRRVGVPLLLPFIGAGFVLSFTWSIGIFGIAFALAGDSAALPIQLITLQIGQALSDDAIRGPERAAVLSVLLMALALGALVVYRTLLRRGSRWLAGTAAVSGQRMRQQPVGGRKGRLASWLLFGGFLAYMLVPIGAVVLYSVAGRWTDSILPDGYTLQHWAAALSSTRITGAFWTSLTLGFWTTVLVLALTIPAAYWARVRNPRIRPILELAAAIPFALPFIVVGFALLHFTGMVVPPLQGSYVLVVLAYVAVSFPFVFWAIDGALAAADIRRLSEAAAAAGASSWQTIRLVVLPNIRAGIATAAMLAFALAIGEFALVKVLAGSLNTVPVLSASMMNASGGSFAPVAVMTTVVFVLLFVISVAVAWVNRERLGSGYGRAAG